mmetsp:Transcript_37291/g.60764  ORF Transcript_37291/g.60764 Transcript_37291/m.60764 type:complete len:150 (+) Transcript_37291:1237-1686(+)
MRTPTLFWERGAFAVRKCALRCRDDAERREGQGEKQRGAPKVRSGGAAMLQLRSRRCGQALRGPGSRHNSEREGPGRGAPGITVQGVSGGGFRDSLTGTHKPRRAPDVRKDVGRGGPWQWPKRRAGGGMFCSGRLHGSQCCGPSWSSGP